MYFRDSTRGKDAHPLVNSVFSMILQGVAAIRIWWVARAEANAGPQVFLRFCSFLQGVPLVNHALPLVNQCATPCRFCMAANAVWSASPKACFASMHTMIKVMVNLIFQINRCGLTRSLAAEQCGRFQRLRLMPPSPQLFDV